MDDGSINTVATAQDVLGLLDGQRSTRCQLVIVEGPDMGRAISIGEEPLVIGTDRDCALTLTDDRVSRCHLEVLAREDGAFVVRDLDSRNGTLYEGSLFTKLTVSAGATFKLGRSFIRIQPYPHALEVMPSQSRRFGDLVAESLGMREVFAVLELAAGSDATVLIEGETGTGKELAARAIHEASARRRGPFIAIDCGALPETLLESELFGHVRGAFTGASDQRKGVFLRANGGTLFLDELGGVPLNVQARLLRVLEERRLRQVGADVEQEIDVRVVAASRHDLSALVTEGSFRPDLFYRLSVIRVLLPPLRQRREDIGAIVKELLRLRGIEAGEMNGGNHHVLIAHDWPGNVRELRNVIERAVALSPGARSFGDLRLSVRPNANSDPLTIRADLPYAEAKRQLLEAFEQRYLRDVFERCDGNISAASRVAEVDRGYLRTLLRRHKIL